MKKSKPKTIVILTDKDFYNVDTALRLRAEACEENNDTDGVKAWSKTLKRMRKLGDYAGRKFKISHGA